MQIIILQRKDKVYSVCISYPASWWGKQNQAWIITSSPFKKILLKCTLLYILVVFYFIQLRGEAGKRQVEGARIGLQHNFGIGGAAVVTMYRAMGVQPSSKL